MICTTAGRTRPVGLLLVAALVTGLSVVLAATTSSVAGAAYPVDLPAGAVTAVALPTVQTDGIVFSVAIVGDTVYAGGRFTKARPAGTSPGDPAEVTRNNLLAFSLSTGQLLPWAPVVQGTSYTSTTAPDAFCKTLSANTYVCDTVFRVKATPDGSRVYVAGDFTSINGSGRYRVAAFDTAGGALRTDFKPVLSSRVRGLAVTADSVYVGGDFTTVNATISRSRLAAFSLSGDVSPWAPTADKTVWALSAAPAQNKVVIGGNFATINTTTIHGLAAVDLTGATAPWAYRSIPAGSVVTDIVNDGTAAYATGYDYATSNSARFEGRIALELNGGTLRWLAACFGDTQSLAISNGLIYSASHAHDCQYANGHPQTSPTNYQRMLAESTAVGGAYQGGGNALVAPGTPIPSQAQWYPDVDGGPDNSYWKNGPWSVAANDTYVVYGGEFLTVNGAAQQSLVRFAAKPISTGMAPNPFPVPTATAASGGSVRVTFTATYDEDSPVLRYELLRSDKSDPVATMTLPTAFWMTSAQTMTDRSLPAGATVTYRVRAVDPDNNRTSTNSTASVTGTATAPVSTGYAAAVGADTPLNYWRLGEAGGATTLQDSAGGDDLTVRAQVATGQPGALSNDSNTAAQFGAVQTTGSVASTSTSRYAPDTFSAEVWFKTTTTRGGQLLGWSSATTGTSTTSDRKIYMDNSGKLYFGVSPGSKIAIASPAAYNNGAWHHAVATLGAAGMHLYVDGAEVASNTATRLGQFVRAGYWRLGNDSLAGWPSAPTTGNFAGLLDEAAIYSTQLPGSAVSAHYGARLGSAPTAAFTPTCTGLSCGFDAAASTDSDGTITGYAWAFGDGSTGTGATVQHAYTAAGTYQATLTVTDNSGLTGTKTTSVTVTATGPSAAFTSSCPQLSCSFDAGTSTAGSTPITAYAWDYGDHTTGTGVTSTHTYAATGTYPVTLTVITDGGGLTSTKTTSVTAQAPVASGTVASDSFNRSVTGGWGSAETGGAWTVTSTAANYGVSAGSATMTVPTAGATRTASLNAVSAADVDMTVGVAQDRVPAAGSTYTYLVARQVSVNTDYRLRLRYQNDGSVRILLVRRAGSTTDVAIGTEVVVSGLSPTTPTKVRFAVTGSATTTLQAKAWAASSTEPGTWQVSATDTTSALQAAGSVALSTTVSSTNTGVPTTGTFTSVSVTAPQP